MEKGTNPRLQQHGIDPGHQVADDIQENDNSEMGNKFETTGQTLAGSAPDDHESNRESVRIGI